MAFNNVGDFWLAPGASVRIALARGNLVPDEDWGGEDFGAQWIMADPKGDPRGFGQAHLMVSDHSKERKAIHGHPGSAHPITYEVTVRNVGPMHANFSLQGGGNV